VSGDATTTAPRPEPHPLTGFQAEALRHTFAHLLHWPPRPAVGPPILEAVARRLDISDSSLRSRLAGVLGKARQLGQHRDVAPSSPEYLYVLVQAGYLLPPPTTFHREPCSWLEA
jgi:AraC-like DNA-binding protein